MRSYNEKGMGERISRRGGRKGRKMTKNVNAINQFGKDVLLIQMGLSNLLSICEMDLPLYWKIDKESIIAERDWFLTQVENKSVILLAPFIFSSRGCLIVSQNQWDLLPDEKLFILMGQERMLGLASAVQFLQAKKDAAEQEQKPRKVRRVEQELERLTTLSISMQIYLDLSLEEEKKLYHDLNVERRSVHSGGKMKYDHRSEFAVLTRRVAERIEEFMEVEQQLSRLMDQSSALTSLSVMHKCTLAMWEGDLDGKALQASNRLLPSETIVELSEEFYKAWQELFPVKASHRQQYVSGLSGIQIALAYTVYLLTKEQKLPHRKAIQKLTTLKSLCTWKHHDPLFSHLFDTTTGRIKNHSQKGSIKKTARKFLMKITEGV